jgi:hypothetical protein
MGFCSLLDDTHSIQLHLPFHSFVPRLWWCNECIHLMAPKRLKISVVGLVAKEGHQILPALLATTMESPLVSQPTKFLLLAEPPGGHHYHPSYNYSWITW